jgi:hypothetical protein
LPLGATLLGTILSSDKTTISAMTGNRVAHPLLISLANIRMDVRLKSSNQAYLLLALLPVPKFIASKKQNGFLEKQLLHACIGMVLEPLRKAAALGVMMSDPLGYKRYCFTPIAAYVADLQEALAIAGVNSKTSPLTMATYTKFGDPFPHEPRTASTTIAQLQAVEDAIGTDAPIDVLLAEAKKFRLSGFRPFWGNYSLSDPSVFLTPEPLHHWHKMFWDHDARWCIRLLGAAEIDFCFSILQTQVGHRHFKEGISGMKQVTGREHQDIQRYIIPIIAGAAPQEFVIAIRALIDFRYRAQARVLTDRDCNKVLAALDEFHDHKQSILDAGVRVGKRSNPIDNWDIPKLELMQSVVPSIRANGAPIQYSADATEHANITEIKEPADHSNNRLYEPQICRNLDRLDKCKRFDLATSIRAASSGSPLACDEMREEDDDVDSDDHDLYVHVNSVRSGRQPVDYFAKASWLLDQQPPDVPRPHRTFSNLSTAFNLNRDASFKIMTVDEVAQRYGLSDLRPALADFVNKLQTGYLSPTIIGGSRKSPVNALLPFDGLQVWTKLRLQTRSLHQPFDVLPAQTLRAVPPSPEYNHGQYDAVVINIEPQQQWPASGIKGLVFMLSIHSSTYLSSGHCIAELRLIFHPMLPATQVIPGLDRFLSYAYRFDFIHRPSRGQRGLNPDPATGMYLLKRSTRNDGTRMGDVLPVAQICAPADLVPHFGPVADPHLTRNNQRELCTEFWLNKTFDKDTYFILDA